LALIIKRKGAISPHPRATAHRNIVHVPPADNACRHIVHFASDFARYCDLQELFQQIKAYINKYLSFPVPYDDLSALYVLLSWCTSSPPPFPTLQRAGRLGFQARRASCRLSAPSVSLPPSSPPARQLRPLSSASSTIITAVYTWCAGRKRLQGLLPIDGYGQDPQQRFIALVFPVPAAR
jgi:hypothetical protein